MRSMAAHLRPLGRHAGGRAAVHCRWGDAGFLVAICAAIWLFFYCVPAHGEGPKIEDSMLYTICGPPIREIQDLEWFTKFTKEHTVVIKPSGTGRCATLLGADLRWLVDELRKRGYDGGHPAILLPSQEEPNFFFARMCRDRQVLSGLKTAATNILKTKVIVASGDGPEWSGYEPDDIRLEAVSILGDGKAAIFCSVTVSAEGITERIVYSVGNDGAPGSWWVLKFGGDLGPHGGGHKLFPQTIEVRPGKGPSPRPTSPG
jgi:hypothetical protein